MWLHIVAGGGFATMYSAVTFWGAQTILEAVYMHHLTLFMVGVALTLAGGYLNPQVELSRIPSVALGTILYINGLWFFVWQLLEWGLTPELYRMLVEWWGGLYYAWGYHPVFPVLYWDRLTCLLVSLPMTAAGFLMLVCPFSLVSSASLFGMLYSLMTATSNLRLDPAYLAAGLAGFFASYGLLVRFNPKLFVTGLLVCAAAAGAVGPALSPDALNSHEGVFSGQPVFFACEHLPDGWMLVPAAAGGAVTCVNLKTGLTITVSEPTLLWGGDWWLVSNMPFSLQRV